MFACSCAIPFAKMFKSFEHVSPEIYNKTLGNFYSCPEAAMFDQLCYTPSNARGRFCSPFSIRSILSRSSTSDIEVYQNDQIEFSAAEQKNNGKLSATYNYSPSFYKGDLSTKAFIDEIEHSPSSFYNSLSESRWSLDKDQKQREEKDKKSSKKNFKRTRTIFTPNQLQRLEKEFSGQQYVAGDERKLLAAELQLSETQVKVWFQNRRIRFRKQNRMLKTSEAQQFSSNEPIRTTDQTINSSSY